MSGQRLGSNWGSGGTALFLLRQQEYKKFPRGTKFNAFLLIYMTCVFPEERRRLEYRR